MCGAFVASIGSLRIDFNVSRRNLMLTLNYEQPSPSSDATRSVQACKDAGSNKSGECSGENEARVEKCSA